MAISANKSPSPTPNSNSRNNSGFRNSENNSPMRRSFNGNPLQRASKSPADFSSGNCFGKEEKENEKDYQTLKPAKARSPAVPKGVNHFMIPTISAVSKINPSPRKKVLADRNEPLRTSLSFSDGRSSVDYTEDSDQKPFKGFNSKDSETEYSQENNKAVLETPSNINPLPKFQSHITPLKSPKFSESSDMFSSTKAFISSVSPSIAPLDADPSVPPYDPKTNYLSPRPQFLHYKPNPRHKLYFQKEQGSATNNLEEIFSSESFSDTDFSEGSSPEFSRKECEDDSSADVSDSSSVKVVSGRAEREVSKLEQTTSAIRIHASENNEVNEESEDVYPVVDVVIEKKTEDASSTDVVRKVVDGEVLKHEVSKESEAENSQDESQDESLDEDTSKEARTVSEPEQIPTNIKGKRKVISGFFMKVKFIPLLLLFVFACVSMPFINPLVRENLSTSKFYEESFNGVARNLKIWSDYSTSYINELTSTLRRVDKLVPLQFYNLTYTVVDPLIDMRRFEEIYEQDVLEDEDEFESLLDQNMEEDDQNSENYLEFESEITSTLQNSIVFEEKSHVEAPEFGPEEAAPEVVSGGGAYNSELVEILAAEGDDLLVSTSELESTTAVPSFGNTFEYNPKEEAAASEVAKGDRAKTVGNEGDDHLVSDTEIESSTPVPTLGKTFDFSSEIESTTEASNFENTSEVVGTSQVGPGYIFETPENGEIKGDNLLISDSEIVPTEIESDSENTLELDAASTLDLMPEYKSSRHYKALAMALVALALIAAPVLSYLKKRNANTHNTSVLVDPISMNKTIKSNPSMQQYSPEIVGESCASEMSSSDRSYSYSKRYTSGATNEAQSQERKQKRVLRRDLLASSSGISISESPSYGSFTTYEKIPKKHAYGEDEVATPVRRSSRIKKIQVTSP